MFTGIVEQIGIIASLEGPPEGRRLRIRALLASSLAVGGSVAVNGCCLTVVEAGDGAFAADLSGETLRRTSFRELKPGTRVNLEPPLAAGKEFGGHFVQGHVDGIGGVARLAQERENWRLSVRVPAELGRYVAVKGSLAVDGISLTVAGWRDAIADFAIIPFTYSHTNVCDLAPGDPVNIECDVLAKYVERLLEARSGPVPSRLTAAKLAEEGF